MNNEEKAIREAVLAEIRENNRRYKAEWRKRNRDKVRASNEKYRLNKAKQLERAATN